jgi:hypothetical protein
MTDHGIIFCASMVRAILAGQKSVTRRTSRRWLKVQAGDRLWVRETWCPSCLVLGTDTGECEYRATQRRQVAKWSPSIHMPRSVSRITLEATENARLERLGEMDDAEYRREGMECFAREQRVVMDLRTAFLTVWEALHGDWGPGDEVVRLAFRVTEVRA